MFMKAEQRNKVKSLLNDFKFLRRKLNELESNIDNSLDDDAYDFFDFQPMMANLNKCILDFEYCYMCFMRLGGGYEDTKEMSECKSEIIKRVDIDTDYIGINND